MKNIHVLPTENESRIRYNSFNKVYELCEFPKYHTDIKSTHNIYITSNEEIKEGDYWLYICPIKGLDYGDNNKPIVKNNLPNSWFEKLHDRLNYKKIILTTDQDLIKDGVQAIDDEFLEFFVKNPTCEEVETVFNNRGITGAEKILKTFGEYKIIIPKEEAKQDLEKEMFELEQELNMPSNLRWHNSKPKQETLEEIAQREGIYRASQNNNNQAEAGYNAKWFKRGAIFGAKWQAKRMYSEEELEVAFFEGRENNLSFNEWFEQFKKK